jgi:nitrogen fixation protein NifX
MAIERRLQLVECTIEDGWVASAIKVAFATKDMKHVNQHFGAARSFAIYAVEQDKVCLMEAAEFGELAMDARPGEQGQDSTEGGDPNSKGATAPCGTEPEAPVSRRRSHPRDAGPLLNASGYYEDKLAAKIEVLKGCAAVYSQAIGASAIGKLRAENIQPLKVAPGTPISELLASLQDELKLGQSGWLVKAVERADPSRFNRMEEEGWEE